MNIFVFLGKEVFRLWSLSLIFSIAMIEAYAEPIKFEIRGDAAILVDADSGAILFEHRAHAASYPASTTKIATALYAMKKVRSEWGQEIVADLDSVVSITPEKKRRANYTLPSHWLETDASHIGIKKGETLSLRALFEGLLIASGDDAANVIAHALGPTIPTFMEGMNAYIKELGCKNTYFCNPHGLHDPRHVTTAYDLAMMSIEAMKYPLFAEVVAKPRFNRPKTNLQAATTFLQTNRLLRQGKLYYPKAIGIKTGYHSLAKKTFVGAAKHEGRTLIVVLLGYPNANEIFEDSIRLFETAFNQPKVQRIFLKAGPQVFKLNLPKASEAIQTYLKEALSWEYYPAEDPQAKCYLSWKSLELPIRKNEQVAEIQLISAQGSILKTLPLFSEKRVSYAWPYSWWNILSNMSWKYFLIGEFAFIAMFVFLFKQSK